MYIYIYIVFTFITHGCKTFPDPWLCATVESTALSFTRNDLIIIDTTFFVMAHEDKKKRACKVWWDGGRWDDMERICLSNGGFGRRSDYGPQGSLGLRFPSGWLGLRGVPAVLLFQSNTLVRAVTSYEHFAEIWWQDMLPFWVANPNSWWLSMFSQHFSPAFLRGKTAGEAAKSRFKRHDVSGDGRLDLQELLLGEAGRRGRFCKGWIYGMDIWYG